MPEPPTERGTLRPCHALPATGAARLTLPARAVAADIGADAQLLAAHSPVEIFKARKNAAEVAGLARSGAKDAAVIVAYFAWLEEALAAGRTVSEADGADELTRRRGGMEGYVGDSFPTISSTGPNAAVIHYQPAHGACKVISPHDVYLCDTGAQFVDGTTDITRTLHFGQPTADEKRAYTRVLQGCAPHARPPRTLGGRRRRTATPHAQAHCAGARRLPARHARADARDARARRDQNPPATPHGRVRRRVAA